MTLPLRCLGQSSRLGLASTFRLFSGRHAQWRLQRNIITSFDKVADADSKTSGQEPQRLQCWITQSPFQFGEESWRNYVAGSVDLGDPPDPPSPTYIGTNESSESVEIHKASRTRAALLLETNKRMILFDCFGLLSEYLGLEVHS